MLRTTVDVVLAAVRLVLVVATAGLAHRSVLSERLAGVFSTA